MLPPTEFALIFPDSFGDRPRQDRGGGQVNQSPTVPPKRLSLSGCGKGSCEAETASNSASRRAFSWSPAGWTLVGGECLPAIAVLRRPWFTAGRRSAR